MASLPIVWLPREGRPLPAILRHGAGIADSVAPHAFVQAQAKEKQKIVSKRKWREAARRVSHSHDEQTQTTGVTFRQKWSITSGDGRLLPSVPNFDITNSDSDDTEPDIYVL